MTGITKISDHRNLELYIIIIISYPPSYEVTLKYIMVNVLQYAIVWYVIPISRCPDQPSCDHRSLTIHRIGNLSRDLNTLSFKRLYKLLI